MASYSSTRRRSKMAVFAVGLALSGACGVPAAKVSMSDENAQSAGSDDLDPLDPRNFDVESSDNVAVVKASFNKHSQMGIKHLHNEDWDLAEEAFQAALIDNAEDEKSMFGLAVALEKQQKWRKASKWYKSAVIVYPRDKYTQGRRRVESHFQKDR